jgi:hypothetical protein
VPSISLREIEQFTGNNLRPIQRVIGKEKEQEPIN